MAITLTTIIGPITDANGEPYANAVVRFTPSAVGGDDPENTVIAQSPVDVATNPTTGDFSIDLAPSDTVIYSVELVLFYEDKSKAYSLGKIYVPDSGSVALEDLLPAFSPDIPTNEELLAALAAAVASAEASADSASSDASDASDSADAAEASAASIDKNFSKTLTDLKLLDSLTVGDVYETEGYLSQGDGGGNLYEIVAAATGTDDGGSYINLPTSGLQAKALWGAPWIKPEQFGGFVGRANAASATSALNLMMDFARTSQKGVLLGEGSYFTEDYIDMSGCTVVGMGLGHMSHLAAAYRDDILQPARTQLVYTGDNATPINIYGISSMQSCGARRVFSNPRPNHNETNWDLTSLMNEDATTGVATVKDLKVIVLVEDLTNTHLSMFRILPDGGGDDGVDDYNDDTHNDFVGDCDIGLLQIGAKWTTCIDMQFPGTYKIAGYYNCASPREEDADTYSNPSHTNMVRCMFEGMRAAAVRGPDRFYLIDYTTSTIEVPWADDHPFTLDGDNNVFRMTGSGAGTSAGNLFRYTGVAKYDAGGGDVRVRLSGVTRVSSGSGDGDPFDPDGFDAVSTSFSGGPNSHILFDACQFNTLKIPSGHNPTDTVNFANPISNGATGGIEISGWRSAETEIRKCRIQHSGTIGIYQHDTRETHIDTLFEGDQNTSDSDFGMRCISSGSASTNTYALYPAGGGRWGQWDNYTLLEATSGHVDVRPFMPNMNVPSWIESADDGWFDANWMMRPVLIRANTDNDRLEAGVRTLKIGTNAEGVNGFTPEADLHVQVLDANANVLIEATENGNDAILRMETERRKLRLDVSDSNRNVKVLYDGNDGGYVEVAKYEDTGSAAGWHFELPGPFADDSAAASGGVAIDAAYRKTGGTVAWRQS